MPTPILHSNTLTGDFESWIKTGGARNSSHLNDANLDRLIDAQKAEFDEPTRRELVNELQRAVMDLASPIGLTATSAETVVHGFVKTTILRPATGHMNTLRRCGWIFRPRPTGNARNPDPWVRVSCVVCAGREYLTLRSSVGRPHAPDARLSRH